ncbi:hypothetical protein F4694_005766 [Bacillus niacini]|uniref:Uncharacterized protein n=1 Tax=Neobacillus niacini TaxID=86668 RepID=A0A852TKR4_9BACI|nr:hypothetical protein [Neobacillus niacini]NYE08909.1 hypothetical protein [Neobacillus niacini]
MNELKVPGTTRSYHWNIYRLLNQAYFPEVLSLQPKLYYSKKTRPVSQGIGLTALTAFCKLNTN